MTGVDADLATLRAALRHPHSCTCGECRGSLNAVDRVEAEIARLREERDALRAKLTTPLDAPTEYDLTGREGE